MNEDISQQATQPINDGGSAFPVPCVLNGNSDPIWGMGGMSLRDWFAGQALAGMCADSVCGDTIERYAKNAYLFADAMLAERAKKGGAL